MIIGGDAPDAASCQATDAIPLMIADAGRYLTEL